jgi:amino acid transporter
MRALGTGGSYVCTWAIILAYISVAAFEACAFPTVIQYLFPGFMKGYLYTIAGFDIYATWVIAALVLTVVITVINYIGVKPAAVFNTILTVVIAAVGIALVAGSTVNGNPDNLFPLFDNGSGGLLKVVVMTPFLFVGFDVIPQAAEEINIPLKKIGGVLLLSIVMAVAFYVLVILGVAMVMSKGDIAAASLTTADAMQRAFFNSSAAAKVLIIGGMAGILTSWNSFFVGGSRALYAMAESKMLPKFLSKIHPKYKTPSSAVILIGVFCFIAPFFGRRMLVWLVDAGSFTTVVAYLLVSISFLVLRFTEPDMERPYKVRFGKLVGILATGMGVFMIILYIPGMPSGLTREELIITGISVVLGAALGIAAKVKYGKEFGEAEGLIKPVKYRKLAA